jgi:hypothetical protein
VPSLISSITRRLRRQHNVHDVGASACRAPRPFPATKY